MLVCCRFCNQAVLNELQVGSFSVRSESNACARPQDGKRCTVTHLGQQVSYRCTEGSHFQLAACAIVQTAIACAQEAGRRQQSAESGHAQNIEQLQAQLREAQQAVHYAQKTASIDCQAMQQAADAAEQDAASNIAAAKSECSAQLQVHCLRVGTLVTVILGRFENFVHLS